MDFNWRRLIIFSRWAILITDDRFELKTVLYYPMSLCCFSCHFTLIYSHDLFSSHVLYKPLFDIPGKGLVPEAFLCRVLPQRTQGRGEQ